MTTNTSRLPPVLPGSRISTFSEGPVHERSNKRLRNALRLIGPSALLVDSELHAHFIFSRALRMWFQAIICSGLCLDTAEQCRTGYLLSGRYTHRCPRLKSRFWRLFPFSASMIHRTVNDQFLSCPDQMAAKIVPILGVAIRALHSAAQ